MSSKIVKVRIKRHYKCYNIGEVAGFDLKEAAFLESVGGGVIVVDKEEGKGHKVLTKKEQKRVEIEKEERAAKPKRGPKRGTFRKVFA